MERAHSRLWSTIALLGLPILLVIPAGADAASVSPSAPAASDGAGESMVFAIAILALLAVIGVGVRVYDRKRKVEDEVAALQGRITDAFFTERALSSVAITPTVKMPLRRSGLVRVIIGGTVPTPELRDTAIALAMQRMEESQVGFQLEDRISVDPMMSRRAA